MNTTKDRIDRGRTWSPSGAGVSLALPVGEHGRHGGLLPRHHHVLRLPETRLRGGRWEATVVMDLTRLPVLLIGLKHFSINI